MKEKKYKRKTKKSKKEEKEKGKGKREEKEARGREKTKISRECIELYFYLSNHGEFFTQLTVQRHEKNGCVYEPEVCTL